MTDRSKDERDRAVEEAMRMAGETQEQAKAEVDRVMAAALTGDAREEYLRQQGLIYGGLIGVAVLMVQPFLTAPSLETSAQISMIAFALAIPLLAALVLVNHQETFRARRTASASVTVAQVVAQASAFVGLVAGFWHISWIAGLTFLVAGFTAIGVHSAGFWRVESPPTDTPSTNS